MTYNIVEFNPSALEVLRMMGIKYYSCVIDPEDDYSIQMYPFKTEAEAHLFMAEFEHDQSELNYIMEDDEVLEELSKGVRLLKATVLIKDIIE